MLIKFSVKNWMSFRDESSFSMVASLEKQHSYRVSYTEKNDVKILPIAAIYGGNASGKTSLFKALSFMKNLILIGTRPDDIIPTEQFLLDKKFKDAESSFSISILINEDIFEFSFSTTKTSITKEKLVKINKSSEVVLYDRKDGSPNFSKEFANNDFFKFAFKGTRDNQLFLTNSVSLNINEFRPVYDWFKDCLELIAPDARFSNIDQFFDSRHTSYTMMNEILPQLDTGISRLYGEEIPLDSIKLPSHLLNDMEKQFKEGNSVAIFRSNPLNTNDREIISITKENDKLSAKKLATMHKDVNGNEVQFSMKQESDGTIRLIDMLPAFLEISRQNSNKVIVADEIDRSIHPLMMKKLFETYLYDCSANTRSQLLFTTHNFFYMDQSLLRRDEMWVTERDDQNISKIFSLGDFKDIRYDKDIQKCYFQNRFGGTPNITLGDTFSPYQDNSSMH
jgi:AAA15 family ATPase/GTPase